jgi:hypothetical protein
MGVPEREVKRGAAARLRPLPQEGLLDLNLDGFRLGFLGLRQMDL